MDLKELKNAAQFDLLAISGADLVAVLLDLTKFDESYPELAEKALSMLFSVSQPHVTVIEAVQKTQLLACQEFNNIFNQCGPALRSLRNQVDLAEVPHNECRCSHRTMSVKSRGLLLRRINPCCGFRCGCKVEIKCIQRWLPGVD